MGCRLVADLVWVPDKGAMQSFLTGGSGPSYRAVRKMQTQTAARADSKVPVDVGALKQSQVKTPIVVTGDKVVGGVEYRAKYAMFVHEGTRAHPIAPKNKKVLAWIPRGSGKAVFAKHVNHPGTKAQPWLRDALQSSASSAGFTFVRE